jgi:hypothetical protein
MPLHLPTNRDITVSEIRAMAKIDTVLKYVPLAA